MRVLVATPELAPFVQVGEAAEAMKEVALAFTGLGHDLRLIMPGYGSVDWAALGFKRVIGPVAIPVGWSERPAELWQGELAEGVPLYVVMNPYYFGSRRAVSGDADDAYRFAFFSRAVLTL